MKVRHSDGMFRLDPCHIKFILYNFSLFKWFYAWHFKAPKPTALFQKKNITPKQTTAYKPYKMECLMFQNKTMTHISIFKLYLSLIKSIYNSFKFEVKIIIFLEFFIYVWRTKFYNFNYIFRKHFAPNVFKLK